MDVNMKQQVETLEQLLREALDARGEARRKQMQRGHISFL